jgi:polyhydroxyalkanoate synthase
MKQDLHRTITNINQLLIKLLTIYKQAYSNDNHTLATIGKSFNRFLNILPNFADIQIILESLEKITTSPEQIITLQKKFIQQHSKIYSQTIGSIPTTIIEENNYFIYLTKTYKLLQKFWLKIIDVIPDCTIEQKNRLKFYYHNMLSSYAPQNFLHINPELLFSTIENIGKNIFNSIESYLQDIIANDGFFNIKNTDFAAFNIGENLATTPGKVVFKNDLMELIKYYPTTKKVYRTPILLIPPCINKYYILDLSEKNSLVKWLVNQGFLVYIISWVNPNETLHHKTFSDYILDGPLQAINQINKLDNCHHVHLVGYCIGGTFLGCLLSYMQQLKDDRAISATHFMSLLDFTELGNLGGLINESSIHFLENLINKQGYLDGRLLNMVFSSLRSNDLIWPYIVNYYLLNKPLKPFDILYWNADVTHVPATMYNFYLRELCLNNKLIIPNQITVNGVGIDLAKVTTPIFSLAGETDHITLWQAVYSGAKLYRNSNVEFVLANLGHIKGLLSSPLEQDSRHAFRVNSLLPKNSDVWLASSKQHNGSWWNYWVKWLTNIDAKQITYSNSPNKISHSTLNNAPGTYVLKKIGNINYLKSGAI